jgi:hypothetical protein
MRCPCGPGVVSGSLSRLTRERNVSCGVGEASIAPSCRLPPHKSDRLAGVFRPGHRPSQVGGDQGSVGWVPYENRVGLGKCDERGHRFRAGCGDVPAVVTCHDHQLETAVIAVGSSDPVRVHDLDATRFLARSRHDSQSRDFGVSPALATEGRAASRTSRTLPAGFLDLCSGRE